MGAVIMITPANALVGNVFCENCGTPFFSQTAEAKCGHINCLMNQLNLLYYSSRTFGMSELFSQSETPLYVICTNCMMLPGGGWTN